ncbi:type I-C CRISPR-associated endonuclease Cas1c [Marichromatium gracile]|uniref:type I-C CRISPR-associated endonuclease Cas1c n=1 Tax=Marichromatium gracile TaxID=1048 RepID=UPI001F20D8A0|nr:type I-C CRISPR-associated endonuclease Cas1c [Marichromatium gracile]MCF1182298.1 type I-C CRISPR-associated endonuclease Cas1c [Marichromatium gracile]
MRRLLNTLYVTTEGAWIRKDGANIVVEVEGTERGRLPVHMLESLVCLGRMMVSPQLLGYCAEQGICVSFLSPNGRFLARMEGPVSGNVLLRREQYRRSDESSRCAALVRNLLTGKVHNQRAVIGRALRDHGTSLAPEVRAALEQVRKGLRRIIIRLREEASLEVLRGLEGDAARAYFGVYGHLMRVDLGEHAFNGRNRRPPRDPVNALLSFLYTLLTHDCRSALETVGLDPAVGFLHRDRPGRPSLALDLVEELRPVVADRLALTLLNRKQLTRRDFIFLDNGAVLLEEGARKTLLSAYQERKREMVQHLFFEEQAPLGLFPLLQAQLLARHLRGDLDAYPPCLWR